MFVEGSRGISGSGRGIRDICGVAGLPAFAEASCGICGVRAECGWGMRGICGVVGRMFVEASRRDM